MLKSDRISAPRGSGSPFHAERSSWPGAVVSRQEAGFRLRYFGRICPSRREQGLPPFDMPDVMCVQQREQTRRSAEI